MDKKEYAEPTLTTPDSVLNGNYEHQPTKRKPTTNQLTITIIIACVACVVSLVAGIAIGKAMGTSTTQGPGGSGQMPSGNGFGPGGSNNSPDSQQQSSSSSSSSSTGTT